MAEPEAKGLPEGWLTFRYAAVMEKHGFTPEEMAAMTDYQLDGLAAYPRTSDGVLIAPEKPDTEPEKPVTDAERLRTIEMLASAGIITAANAAALREQLKNRAA